MKTPGLFQFRNGRWVVGADEQHFVVGETEPLFVCHYDASTSGLERSEGRISFVINGDGHDPIRITVETLPSNTQSGQE